MGWKQYKDFKLIWSFGRYIDIFKHNTQKFQKSEFKKIHCQRKNGVHLLNHPVQSNNIPSLQYTRYMQSSPSDTNSFAISSLYIIHYTYIILYAMHVLFAVHPYTSNLYVIFPSFLYIYIYIAGPLVHTASAAMYH